MPPAVVPTKSSWPNPVTDEGPTTRTDGAYFNPPYGVRAVMPATGTPEPGGLDWYQVTNLIAAVTAGRRVVALDLVETRPLTNQVTSEFLAARLIARTIGLVARAAGWPMQPA